MITDSITVGSSSHFIREFPKTQFHSLTVGILKIKNFGVSISEDGALSVIPTREGITLSEN